MIFLVSWWTFISSRVYPFSWNVSQCGKQFLSMGCGYTPVPCSPRRSASSCATAAWPVPVTLWYVFTTPRSICHRSCRGLRHITSCMVVQLGLAMTKSCSPITSPFTSGTTNLWSSDMRHALLLSTTVVPTSANRGAHSKLKSPPAEKRATCGFWAKASSIDTTFTSFPRNVTVLPTERCDATGNNVAMGKFRASNTANIVRPTMPVAPTTATFNGVSSGFMGVEE